MANTPSNCGPSSSDGAGPAPGPDDFQIHAGTATQSKTFKLYIGGIQAKVPLTELLRVVSTQPGWTKNDISSVHHNHIFCDFISEPQANAALSFLQNHPFVIRWQLRVHHAGQAQPFQTLHGHLMTVEQRLQASLQNLIATGTDTCPRN